MSQIQNAFSGAGIREGGQAVAPPTLASQIPSLSTSNFTDAEATIVTCTAANFNSKVFDGITVAGTQYLDSNGNPVNSVTLTSEAINDDFAVSQVGTKLETKLSNFKTSIQNSLSTSQTSIFNLTDLTNFTLTTENVTNVFQNGTGNLTIPNITSKMRDAIDKGVNGDARSLDDKFKPNDKIIFTPTPDGQAGDGFNVVFSIVTVEDANDPDHDISATTSDAVKVPLVIQLTA